MNKYNCYNCYWCKTTPKNIYCMFFSSPKCPRGLTLDQRKIEPPIKHKPQEKNTIDPNLKKDKAKWYWLDGQWNTLRGWCEIYDISLTLVRSRMASKKMTLYEALTTPPAERQKYPNLKKIAKEVGLSYEVLRARKNAFWSDEELFLPLFPKSVIYSIENYRLGKIKLVNGEWVRCDLPIKK